VQKMIHREGIGDLLADGVKVAAKKIGKTAADFSVEAGGQELPMHDGRYDPGFSLHYVAEPTPGRHTIGSQLYYEMFELWEKIKTLPDPKLFYIKGSKYRLDSQKAAAAAACSRFMNVINGAGCCLFGAFLGTKRLPTFEWLNAATGWEKTPEDYLQIGGRIQTLKQAFNIKQGIEPKRVSINQRALGHPPLPEGANKGRQVTLEEVLSAYWEEFGWDKNTGKPLPETMNDLDI
jgi:aldehyde:ferredoxin oxidoreductase